MNITDETELPQGTLIIDFWASWCQPCKRIAPILEELDAEFPTVQVLKAETEHCPNLTTEYGVRSLPTLVILQNGVEVGRRVGALPKAGLRKLFEQYA